jgi:hypothetical protein
MLRRVLLVTLAAHPTSGGIVEVMLQGLVVLGRPLQAVRPVLLAAA